MIHPTVYNTSQICHQMGVWYAVFSPGSRNAPLTVSFARNSNIDKYIVPDERAAAFIALGIAQETGSPVVLSCTSGTALLNYAPAIAEAYYRQIPLAVLSADRPPELIDQRDGQTIRQYEALKNHVKKSFQFPVIDSAEDAEVYQKELINALKEADRLPRGPVHINIPFKEPFYPTPNQSLHFEDIEISQEEETPPEYKIPDVGGFERVLILIGQQDHDEELEDQLKEICRKIPVISSPLNNINTGITHVDAFINDQPELRPELLITSGLSVLSKKLKNYLRKNKPEKHLHFDPAGIELDTYQTSPELIKADLKKVLKSLKDQKTSNTYLSSWKNYAGKALGSLDEYMNNADFSEAKATWILTRVLPENINFHVSNSMPVRYIDLFGLKHGIRTFCNRGTSGIDGCTSAALGASLVSSKLNVLLTGDLAFLYDRNAFFHNHTTPNLRVIIMNNAGGGIFRLIDGPSRLDELEEYFETRHNRTAKYICMENSIEYIPIHQEKDFKSSLSSFWEASENAKVMEVFTEPETNQRVYKELRNYINERIEN